MKPIIETAKKMTTKSLLYSNKRADRNTFLDQGSSLTNFLLNHAMDKTAVTIITSISSLVFEKPNNQIFFGSPGRTKSNNIAKNPSISAAPK
jgi:hypothetical protein